MDKAIGHEDLGRWVAAGWRGIKGRGWETSVILSIIKNKILAEDINKKLTFTGLEIVSRWIKTAKNGHSKVILASFSLSQLSLDLLSLSPPECKFSALLIRAALWTSDCRQEVTDWELVTANPWRGCFPIVLPTKQIFKILIHCQHTQIWNSRFFGDIRKTGNNGPACPQVSSQSSRAEEELATLDSHVCSSFHPVLPY